MSAPAGDGPEQSEPVEPPDPVEPVDPDEPPKVPKPPTPAWVGGVFSLCLLLSVLWLLSYALLDLGWQQRLGAWNYLIAVLFSSVTTQGLQRWRGDPRQVF